MILLSSTALPDALPVIRHAQRLWADKALRDRLKIIDRARLLVLHNIEKMAEAIGMSDRRETAQSIMLEILPLLDALRFLRRKAPSLLTPRHRPWWSPPLWMWGQEAVSTYEPLGIIGLLAPSNYPLLLAGVQAAQALVAGNAVIVKPAPGGEACMLLLQKLFAEAGLPPHIFNLAQSDLTTAEVLVQSRLDKIILTGSAATGQAVMKNLAKSLTPSIMELSGCDACIVLPDFNFALLRDALRFSLPLNGGATCIAPRKLILVGDTRKFLPDLRDHICTLPPCLVTATTQKKLADLFAEAVADGAVIEGVKMDSQTLMRPMMVMKAQPEMSITQSDIFAPVLSVLEAADKEEAIKLVNQGAYALAASVFGPQASAMSVASQLRVGLVTINDIIAPSADPQLCFGGVGASGFGVTRGAEGLLAMTHAKHITRNVTGLRMHYSAANPSDMSFFQNFTRLLHSNRLSEKMYAMAGLLKIARRRSAPPKYEI